MYCPSCGEENEAASTVCSSCGTELPGAEAKTEAPTAKPPQEPAHAGGAGQTATQTGIVGGLEENVAGALAYVVGFVTGILFYVLEDDNEFVRFHAMQSTIVFGGLFVLGWLFSFLQAAIGYGGFGLDPTIGWTMWMVGLLLWLVYMAVMFAGFVLWVTLIFKAYNGERWKVPIAGNIAERNA